MTPHDIITREISKIPAIRMPMVRLIVQGIFAALDDEGYIVKDKGVPDALKGNRHV